MTTRINSTLSVALQQNVLGFKTQCIGVIGECDSAIAACDSAISRIDDLRNRLQDGREMAHETLAEISAIAGELAAAGMQFPEA